MCMDAAESVLYCWFIVCSETGNVSLGFALKYTLSLLDLIVSLCFVLQYILSLLDLQNNATPQSSHSCICNKMPALPVLDMDQ